MVFLGAFSVMYEYLLNSFQSCCSGLSLDDKQKPAIKHHRGSSEPHNYHHSWHHSLSLMAHPNLPIVTFYSACVYCSAGIKNSPNTIWLICSHEIMPSPKLKSLPASKYSLYLFPWPWDIISYLLWLGNTKVIILVD